MLLVAAPGGVRRLRAALQRIAPYGRAVRRIALGPDASGSACDRLAALGELLKLE